MVPTRGVPVGRVPVSVIADPKFVVETCLWRITKVCRSRSLSCVVNGGSRSWLPLLKERDGAVNGLWAGVAHYPRGIHWIVGRLTTRLALEILWCR